MNSMRPKDGQRELTCPDSGKPCSYVDFCADETSGLLETASFPDVRNEWCSTRVINTLAVIAMDRSVDAQYSYKADKAMQAIQLRRIGQRPS